MKMEPRSRSRAMLSKTPLALGSRLPCKVYNTDDLHVIYTRVIAILALYLIVESVGIKGFVQIYMILSFILDLIL